MYTPRFNQVADRTILLEAMRANSFAILFGPLNPRDASEPPSADDSAPSSATLGEQHGVVEGHFAKANRHWQVLNGRETLVVFSGPHSYVSPTLYTEDLSVPTWNYIAIHAYGTLETIEDPGCKGCAAEGPDRTTRASLR